MFLSCVATQQKSSSRGSPMCVTTNFISGKEGAAGAPPAPKDEPVRPLRDVAADRVDVAEPLVIEVHQRLRFEDRHVDAAVEEHVVQGFLLAIIRIRIPVPDVLRRTEGLRVVVEAIDPSLRQVRPQPVVLGGVPDMEVVVCDKDVLLLSVRCLSNDQGQPPCPNPMNGVRCLKTIRAHRGCPKTSGTNVCRSPPPARRSDPRFSLRSQKNYGAAHC